MNNAPHPHGSDEDPLSDSAEQEHEFLDLDPDSTECPDSTESCYESTGLAENEETDADLADDEVDDTDVPTWEDAISSLNLPLEPPEAPLAKAANDR